MKRTVAVLLLTAFLVSAAVAQHGAKDTLRIRLTRLQNSKGKPCRVRYTITNASATPVYVPRNFELHIGRMTTLWLVAFNTRGKLVILEGDYGNTPKMCPPRSGKVWISGECVNPKGSAELNAELESSWILLQPAQFVGGEADLPLPSKEYTGQLKYGLTYNVDLSWEYDKAAIENAKYPVPQGDALSNEVPVQVSSNVCSPSK